MIPKPDKDTTRKLGQYPLWILIQKSSTKYKDTKFATYLEDCKLWPSGFYSQNARMIQLSKPWSIKYTTLTEWNVGEKTYAHLNLHRKNIFSMSIPFYNNNNQLRMEENSLNMLKAIYKELTANIIFNDERLKVFPLRTIRMSTFATYIQQYQKFLIG